MKSQSENPAKSVKTVFSRRSALQLACALPFLSAPSIARGQEKVSVRLTWKLKGEFAPLFVALEKGHYAKQGLAVEFLEGSGVTNVTKLVSAGTETIGYGTTAGVIRGASQGMSVKVAAIYQTAAPMALIAFPDQNFSSPKDLEGKKIAISVGESFGELLQAFCRINNVNWSKLNFVQMDMSARNSQFLTRKVDVMSAYTNNELPILEKISGIKFKVIRASDFGLRVFGSAFFTNTQFSETKGETLRKLLRGTAEGFQDALKDPAAAAATMNKYMTVKDDPAVLLAAVKETLAATNAPSDKPIGWQLESEWKDNLHLLLNAGVIEKARDLKDYYTNDFLI